MSGENNMINVQIDGIWCKKCQQIHPTLFWHEKYDNYELNRKVKWLENMKKHFPNEKLEYKDTLYIKDLEECNNIGSCIICGTKTHFKHTTTKNYICSDECKYKDM